MSTSCECFSGEPFRLRDIQFDHPQIGITAPAALPIVRNSCFFGEFGGACAHQRRPSVRTDAAFEEAGIRTAIERQDQDLPGLRIALCQHHRTAARRIDPPDERIDEQAGG